MMLAINGRIEANDHKGKLKGNVEQAAGGRTRIAFCAPRAPVVTSKSVFA
jgi:hypothetical protein